MTNLPPGCKVSDIEASSMRCVMDAEPQECVSCGNESDDLERGMCEKCRKDETEKPINMTTQEIEQLKQRAEKAEALVASYDRQDEVIGPEYEGVDTVTEVIRLLKSERDLLASRCEKAEAACAEMRDLIECFPVNSTFRDQAGHALSTDCGKDFVPRAELEKAQAACAELRRVILDKLCLETGKPVPGFNAQGDVSHALSLDCGKGWLSPEKVQRLGNAIEALIGPCGDQINEYLNRQFPETIGHLPLKQYFDELFAALEETK